MQQSWLVFEFGDERSHIGNPGYADDLASHYDFTSNVNNCKRIREGDLLFVCDTENLVGVGVVERLVTEEGDIVSHKCPACGKSKFDDRKATLPLYRCRCGHAFDAPRVVTERGTRYSARFGDSFVPASRRLSKPDAKLFGTIKAQQPSIRRLDDARLPELFVNLGLTAAQVASLHGHGRQPGPASTPTHVVAQRAPARSTSQGRSADACVNKAVALAAMQWATDWYRTQGWTVLDVSGDSPYDLMVSHGDQQLRVKVKGTTGSGAEVALTVNEVHHAHDNHPSTALFIVHSLDVTTDASGQCHAAGGQAFIIEEWIPGYDSLTVSGWTHSVDMKKARHL